MIGFLSSRYAFSTSSRQRSRSIRTVMTVALSLAMVIVIIAIMDYLQHGRFEEIRAVRSFDAMVEGDHREKLEALLPERTIFVYGEGEALVPDGAYLVRYVDDSYSSSLMIRGDFSSLTIPYTLYTTNRLKDIELSLLRTGKTGSATVKSVTYPVSGVYYSSLGSEFDSTMLFLPLSEADGTVRLVTAVRGATESDVSLLRGEGYTVTTWKEAEESLYSAFLLEKAMMYAVLSLLFLIIAVSMKQSVRIFVESREKEFAELLVLGLLPSAITQTAIASFLVVMESGVAGGLLLGALLLPLLEKLSAGSAFLTMELTLPWGGFLAYALSMTLLTILFSLWETRKIRKNPLAEVIHG